MIGLSIRMCKRTQRNLHNWAAPISPQGGDKPFMEVFDPSSFGKFRQKSNDAKENGQVSMLFTFFFAK